MDTLDCNVFMHSSGGNLKIRIVSNVFPLLKDVMDNFISINLGTWLGKGTEVWGPKSTLLQLFVSIQGLILVSEPYYNEAGYEKQFDSQQGVENSRTYNEFVILKLVQSMTQMLKTPPHIFKEEILSHFAMNGKKMCKRLLKYCSDVDPLEPEFPLQPVSKGFKLTLNASLNTFQDVLEKVLNEHKKWSCRNVG